MKKLILENFIIIFLIASFMISCSEEITEPKTFFVPEDHDTIQEAVDTASDGSEIIVSPGEYFECINFSGKAIRITSLYSSTGDAEYISNTVINASGMNSVVIFNSQETGDSQLSGFTLINGSAGMGGGIICSNNSSPVISDIIIQNNNAIYGAGLGCYSNSNPILTNITIRNNNAENGNGGGMCFYNSSPVLENIKVHDNVADNGGGLYLNNSALQIRHLTLQSNIAELNGGGIYMVQSTADLQNCIIDNNSAGTGGAAYCWNESSLIFSNSTIHANQSKSYGGIYLVDLCESQLENSILWGNSFFEIAFSYIGHSNSVQLSYTDIQGLEDKIQTNNNGNITWEFGNINKDPVFSNPGNHDLHLSSSSPCIDAGNPLQTYDDSDGSRNDLGAYGGQLSDWQH